MYKAAWHTTRDPVRKEAFLLKQVKTLELWQGGLVHRAIELNVVPALQDNRAVNWNEVEKEAIRMAERQFEFSAKRRYREPGMTKKSAGDDYCALVGHEPGMCVSGDDYERVIETVRQALSNLASMDSLWKLLHGRGKYWAELEVRVDYDIAHIEAHLDLLFFRGFKKPTIVDWKISESQGGGDADLQTALYAWTLCQHPRWAVPRAEDCELLEVQLLHKTMITHRADQATFDRLENRIYQSVDGLRAMGFAQKYDLANLIHYDFAENPNNCAFCPVRALCQKLALESNSPMPEQSARSGRSRKESANEPAYVELF
jgi:hypothetical protein